MGRERQQAKGKVLFANAGRAQAAESGNRKLAALRGCRGICPESTSGGGVKMLSRLRHQISGIVRRRGFESGMETELRFHRDEYIADLVRSGISRNEAVRRAGAEFGS